MPMSTIESALGPFVDLDNYDQIPYFSFFINQILHGLWYSLAPSTR